MAKTKKSRKIPRARRSPLADDPKTGENQSGDAITVAWMLTMMATTGADLLALLSSLIVPVLTAGVKSPGMMPALPRMMLLIAVISGVVCLVLTPVVYQFRNQPPPPAITAYGVAVSLAPLGILAWRIFG